MSLSHPSCDDEHPASARVARVMDAAPRGKMIVVEEAGHLIPQESPAVVRDTIFSVAEQLP